MVTGSCSEGSIVVKKNVSDVVLIFDDLTLTASSTAPVVIGKSSTVTIHLEGTSTLTDAEDPDDETSTDTTVADAFEGACIKVKSGAAVTFCGTGTLNINGTAKNGIKGGATASLIFYDSGATYNVTAANNGIASDGSIVIYGGTFHIDAAGDGIKSVPDADDTDSAGTIEICGGTFDIDADGDGIQAEAALTISNGTFDIQTLGGYNDSSFDEDTMSCKGLKASGDREDIENTILITGGTFTLDTADDAVHSDVYVTITGGTFDIRTGDDGVHADTTLTLGTENGCDRDPDITIANSYEGLEAGSVYVYSGRYYVCAEDDGINAAGGSGSEETGFNPGGQPQPGGPGQQHPGSTSSGDYTIEVYGGHIYVDCEGDGIDSNGDLYLYGGELTVFSMAGGGDNSPLDADGTVLVDGAAVCAAGGTCMDGNLNASSFGQYYYQSGVSRSANTKIGIYHNGTLVYSDTLPRRITYLLYTSPDMISNTCTVQNVTSVTACTSNDWAHSWNDGAVTAAAASDAAGVMTYTCSDCGATELQTIPAAVSYSCGGHEASGSEDEGYPVTFVTDEGVASINIFYTQDTSSADETGVTSAVSRNSTTGDPDSTGEGQVNFRIMLNDGYTLDDVTVTGSYKNLKTVDAEALIYRVTKVAGELTITVTTTGGSSGSCCFTDVTDESLFYYDAVYWAAENGIVTGWAESDGTYTFRPTNSCNRAAVVTFLWRLKGCPEPEGDYPFSDPTGNEDFDKAITWACEQGITTGYDDGTFRPWNTCNRAAIVTFLWRYAGEPDAVEGYEAAFSDMTSNENFNKAITWAASYGITTGYDDGTFRPWNSCMRLAIVSFLYRYVTLV